ncbi:2Fe-2S iron-sulfur cluster-binding protein [Bradyrhizobium ontarionense]|uniref:2Fe-2S iron-sulfur cluster-binding protein n=1 Tax=Bradyrhizobium ontarionense TaxID=2898149 RepID=A0ABY3RLI4_9BRAD|nr:2Fe-2S iron-sulfur cluster-binding protein [Bradyrhizobium sp. A19]UFZ08149.1 2Fe-2S iron-sulfur cluster-binding protein [Bradyrhizobium sp. A19]
MPRIIFIEPDGTERLVDAEPDESAMQAAKRNGVDGIIGECGGSCICATCHCHVDKAWLDRVGPAGDIEADLLEFEAADVRAESRLACQIPITEALDGLLLHVVGRSR